MVAKRVVQQGWGDTASSFYQTHGATNWGWSERLGLEGLLAKIYGACVGDSGTIVLAMEQGLLMANNKRRARLDVDWANGAIYGVWEQYY